MSFAGKKGHKSEHQPAFLGIVAFFFFHFFHFTSNTSMLQSSSPSLISLSISQSALLLFLMPHYYRYNFYLSHFPNFCNFILPRTIICPIFFIFLFSASVKWVCGIYQYAFLTFLVNNSYIWSIMFKGLVSLYREIPQDHKISSQILKLFLASVHTIFLLY